MDGNNLIQITNNYLAAKKKFEVEVTDFLYPFLKDSSTKTLEELETVKEDMKNQTPQLVKESSDIYAYCENLLIDRIIELRKIRDKKPIIL